MYYIRAVFIYKIFLFLEHVQGKNTAFQQVFSFEFYHCFRQSLLFSVSCFSSMKVHFSKVLPFYRNVQLIRLIFQLNHKSSNFNFRCEKLSISIDWFQFFSHFTFFRKFQSSSLIWGVSTHEIPSFLLFT